MTDLKVHKMALMMICVLKSKSLWILYWTVMKIVICVYMCISKLPFYELLNLLFWILKWSSLVYFTSSPLSLILFSTLVLRRIMSYTLHCFSLQCVAWTYSSISSSGTNNIITYSIVNIWKWFWFFNIRSLHLWKFYSCL